MNRILLMVLRNVGVVPGAYMKLCRYAKHPDRYSQEERYKHIQFIFDRGIKSGNIDFQVHGLENIPEKDGFLLMSNHQGLFDIMAIVSTCDRVISVVLKESLYKIPFLKQCVKASNSLPIDRDDVRKTMKTMIEVNKALKEGQGYLIFPEGTRSKVGNEMNAFHSGSFKCALKAKCPIVPTALIDCYKVLDEKGSDMVTVQLHYLKPIQYEEFKDMNTTEIANMVKERIQETINLYS